MRSFMTVCGRGLEIEGWPIHIAHLDGEKYRFLEDPEPVLASLRNSPARADLFTFLQRLPETSPKYTYPMEWDNFAALPISTFDNWWNEQICFKARNKARQAARKQVTVREVSLDDALVRGVWEIYNESSVRQGTRFGHFGKNVETVRKELAAFPESSIFIGAFHQDRLIGFIKMVVDESRTQAGLMHIMSMISHRNKAPTNALVAEAVRACANRGIPYLVYSSFTHRGGRKSSLTTFKQRNGFRQIDVPRYWVPLTRRGEVALRFGLHLRLVDHIPESVAARLREARALWYDRRFAFSRGGFLASVAYRLLGSHRFRS